MSWWLWIDPYGDFRRAEAQRSIPPMNQSPPGYPLGYLRERHEITCGGCGFIVEYSRLLTVVRSSASGRSMRPAGASETVYDLPISEVYVRGGTPRCDLCFDRLPRELVPKTHPVTERLKPRWGATVESEKSLTLDDLDL